jgi:chaperonin cofactor prefoldin
MYSHQIAQFQQMPTASTAITMQNQSVEMQIRETEEKA